MVDVAAVGAMYADWTTYGAGVTDYLSVSDMPLDTAGTRFEHPGGYMPGGDPAKFEPIRSFDDDLFGKNVKESIKHAWYKGDWDHHPWDEETVPEYTDFQDNGKYSWIKSPNFKGKPAQVGPLANVLAMYAAGHEPTRRHAGRMLGTINSVLALTGSTARVTPGLDLSVAAARNFRRLVEQVVAELRELGIRLA